MTARHFLDLTDASTVTTDALALTRRAIGDITRHRALGVVHGAAGLGKTFAVERSLDQLQKGWSPVWLSFPVRPTMRLIAVELLYGLCRQNAQGNRFELTRVLKDELARRPHLLICDEAQNLSASSSMVGSELDGA